MITHCTGTKSKSLAKLKDFVQSVNYGCVKESTKWFLDAAGVSFRVTFDDVMMFMTLFVLFADNIRLMTADKSVDDDFIVVNSICLFAFIIELIANTWSKTDNMYFDFLYFFDEEVWIPWFLRRFHVQLLLVAGPYCDFEYVS